MLRYDGTILRKPFQSTSVRFGSLFLLCVATLLCGVGQAQFVHTEGPTIVNPHGKPIHLHGLNLGNWMVNEGYMWKFDGKPLGPSSEREIDELVVDLLGPMRATKFWQTYRDTYYTRQDIHRIRQMGFDSVRVPLHWKFFKPGDEEGFALLDRLVGWCHAEGLLVVIDLHAAEGGNTGANMDDSSGWPWLYTDASAQAATEDVWRRIAHRYRNETAVLGYDLLNEPLPSFPQYRQFDHLLEPLYKRLTKAIRAEDPNHAIIIGGSQWDTDFSVFGPPFDRNLIYEVHRYSVPPTEESLQKYIDFRKNYHVPLWMGEYGENTDTWTAQMTRAAENNDIGWAFWPYKKMDASSSPVTFPRPPHWDEIVAYAKLDPNTGHIEDRLAKRPSQQHIDEAFDGMLRNIQFSQEVVNESNLRALLPNASDSSKR
jgi:endoglucanase